MPENDDTIPGEVQMTIGGAQSEAQRKKNEKQVYDEAQKDVIDPLNELAESEKDPGYISGDGSSPGKAQGPKEAP